MSKSDQNKSFAEQFAELEKIVDWFDGDDLDLDKALDQFEAGMQLAEDLRKKLETVENKVETIKTKFDVVE